MIKSPSIISGSVEITEAAYKLRDELIAKAESITEITDAFEANAAAEAMQSLKDIQKQITQNHKDVKAPYLEISRKLDQIKKEFIEPIESKHTQIQNILGKWQIAEREKKQLAEREARRKEQEIYKQTQEKQLDAMMNDDQDALKEYDESLKLAQIELKNEVDQSHAAVKGIRVRTVLHFEITDEPALLEARPDLFSPDDKKIRSAIKTNKTIPGIKVWEEVKAY